MVIDRQTLLRNVAYYGKGDWNTEFAIIKEKKRFTDEELNECNIQCKTPCIVIGEREYPDYFRETPQPPIALFYYGNKDLLSDKYIRVSVVGTRNPNHYSTKYTEDFLEELIKTIDNIVIVSGMAYGIDSIAHRLAMKHNKPTIAVMGNGIDRYYPNNSKDIYEYCSSGKGLVVSEYPCMVEPLAEHFPPRNRIIAAMADLIFIPEAKDKSGTSITLRYALQMGKTICCLPQRVDDFQLTNNAIKDGAYLINSAKDIKNLLPKKFDKKEYLAEIE